jgi:hypothetical protein
MPEGESPLKPVQLKGKPIPEVCNAFFAKENGARYRARLALSGRNSGPSRLGTERLG